MLGTRIHGDVSYYDQLGVPPTASSEEIRHAYRSLVRILHPDQQTDPELKFAAERQLRKLNRIHALLIDSQQRLAYDQYLAGEQQIPEKVEEDPPELRLRKSLIRGCWLVAAIATVVILFWLGSESPPVEMAIPIPKPRAKAEQQPVVAQSQLGDLRRELAQAVSERDAALHELANLRGRKAEISARPVAPEKSAVRPPLAVFTELPTTQSAGSAMVTSTPAPKFPNPKFPNPKTDSNSPKALAGTWFYIRPKEGQQNKNKSLYPPEFIEITLVEQNGNIRGKYRARYRILDRPISPDVNFEITGKESNGSCACTWRGIGGARGQIAMQLTAENAMKFEWTASEIGTQQGLASGTAVLARRVETR